MNDAGPVGLYLFIGFFACCVVLAVYRRREAIGRKIKQLFVAYGCFVLTMVLARQFTTDATKIFLFAVLVELIVFIRMTPRRSRYIPRSERRKVIARYERSGKRYDPQRHHLDHVVPYSRGGGSRADNLRVIESEKNLAKSDRAPWWDVFSR